MYFIYLGFNKLKLIKLNWRIDSLGWKKIKIIYSAKRVALVNGIGRKKEIGRETQNKKRQRIRWFANFKRTRGIGKKNEGWVWYW
jgi:hypothetical protein